MTFYGNSILGTIQEGIHYVDDLESFSVLFPGGRTMRRLTMNDKLRCKLSIKQKEGVAGKIPLYVTLCCWQRHYVGDEQNNLHSTLSYYTQFALKKDFFQLTYEEQSKAHQVEFGHGCTYSIQWNHRGTFHCFFRLVHPCPDNRTPPQRYQWCESSESTALFPMSDEFIVVVQ